MPSVAELELALAAAKLEEELVAAKRTPGGASRELKLQCRAARRAYREMRAQREPELANGNAVVRPDTIEGAAAPQTPGTS